MSPDPRTVTALIETVHSQIPGREIGCLTLLGERALVAEIERLSDEIEVLRHYGNKDCTHMADKYLERLNADGKRPFQD